MITRRDPAPLIAIGIGLLVAGVTLVALRTAVLLPSALPVLTAAALAGLWLVTRPAWIVPLFLALIWMSVPGHFFGGLPSPVELGGMALLPLALWHGRDRPQATRDVAIIAACIGLPLIATSLVSAEGTGELARPLKHLVFLPVAALCIRGWKDSARVADVMCFTAIFLGAGAAYSVLVHPTDLFPLNEVPTSDEAARAAGPFGESNFFALSLAALVPMALWTMSRGRWRLLLGLGALCAILVGVFAAGSRGGLIATAFAILATGWVGGDPRVRKGCILAIVLGAGALQIFSAQANSSKERTVSGRATENLIALHMFADHPLTGVGPDHYPTLYRDYARDIGNDPRVDREAHSLPLQIAAEQGIAGIAGYLAAGVVLFGAARRNRIWEIALGRALVLSLATFLVGSLFLHGGQQRLLYVLCGLVLAVRE